MHKIIKQILIILAASSFILQGVYAEDSSSEFQKVELASHQYTQGQARSWPTLDWKGVPLIITFENGHIYAFGLKSDNPAWQKRSIGKETVLYSEKDEWGLEGLAMQPWFEIEGQEAFVYRMGKSEALKDVTIMAHERFHRHQNDYFDHSENPGMSRDHLNEDNLVWSEMEDALINEFLGKEGESKLESIKDFAAVHFFRKTFLDPDTVAWENHQLRMEGLADYVSTKLFGGEAQLMDIHPVKEREDFVDYVIKWRHYGAGAALGYALDHLEVLSWKERVEAGENLSDLFAKALPMSPSEKEARIEKVKNRLNYKNRRQKITDRLSKYKRELDQMYASYDKQEGIKLFLDRPPSSISGGGANHKMLFLGDGSTVGILDESVATTREGKWRFETHNVGHLFQHNDGFREVKISKECELKMDQVSHSLPDILQEPKEYLFKSIEINGKEISLNSDGHMGVLVSEGDALTIFYFKG